MQHCWTTVRRGIRRSTAILVITGVCSPPGTFTLYEMNFLFQFCCVSFMLFSVLCSFWVVADFCHYWYTYHRPMTQPTWKQQRERPVPKRRLETRDDGITRRERGRKEETGGYDWRQREIEEEQRKSFIFHAEQRQRYDQWVIETVMQERRKREKERENTDNQSKNIQSSQSRGRAKARPAENRKRQVEQAKGRIKSRSNAQTNEIKRKVYSLVPLYLD